MEDLAGYLDCCEEEWRGHRQRGVAYSSWSLSELR